MFIMAVNAVVAGWWEPVLKGFRPVFGLLYRSEAFEVEKFIWKPIFQKAGCPDRLSSTFMDKHLVLFLQFDHPWVPTSFGGHWFTGFSGNYGLFSLILFCPCVGACFPAAGINCFSGNKVSSSC